MVTSRGILIVAEPPLKQETIGVVAMGRFGGFTRYREQIGTVKN